MNNMNPLEKQLQSWVPRPPSARLKERLFAADGAKLKTHVSSQAAPWLPAWVKFAPALCLLLLVMLFGLGRQGKTGYLTAAGGSNVLANWSPNLLACCATETVSLRLNIWPVPASVATFDWTKTGHSLTTTDSFHWWNTNVPKF